jgi:radical SAM protein with 4Fe4S-binding SPASM domain
VHSLSAEQLSEVNLVKQTMPFETYERAVSEFARQPTSLKALIFSGQGEPLTHPRIADMVKLAKQYNIAERVEIVTNGSLLTCEMSNALIDAGLDRMRISVQGCDAGAYKRVCGADLDFDKFVGNIEYFYRQKRETDLYVKIIDIALDERNSEEKFHKIFDSISDTAFVEHLFSCVRLIDHGTLGGDLTLRKDTDQKAMNVNICAMPFYMAAIMPDGDVRGCCALEAPVIFGNILRESLSEIWNGDTRREFLRLQIGDRRQNKFCAVCNAPNYSTHDADYLDPYSDKLLNLFGETIL